jgi:hypothetical protein
VKKPLSEEEYRQAVLRARSMSGEEKIREGYRLFEQECEEMSAAIRKEIPEASEAAVQAAVLARFEEQRLKEEKEEGNYIRVTMAEAEELLKRFPNGAKPIK